MAADLAVRSGFLAARLRALQMPGTLTCATVRCAAGVERLLEIYRPAARAIEVPAAATLTKSLNTQHTPSPSSCKIPISDSTLDAHNASHTAYKYTPAIHTILRTRCTAFNYY